MSSSKPNGPGLLWQLLEMFGMTWPGHPPALEQKETPSTPVCRSCGNAASWSDSNNRWICSNHPLAATTHDE